MVKTARILALTAAMIACLVGCGLFTGSIFPDELTTFEGYVDLAGVIPQERFWEYNFQIIRHSSTGDEYLVLANDNRDPLFDGVHLAIFDADLKVLGTYTLADLDAMETGKPYGGRGTMVDASGRIVVGNRRFTISSGKLTYADSLPQVGQQGLAIPEAFDPNIADIRTENDLLRYRRYSSDWAVSTEVIKDIGPASWYKVFGFWLRDSDILFVLHHDSWPAEILALDRPLFATGGLGEPLNLTNRPVPNSDQIEWNTLGYTNDGFAAFRKDTKQYFRFNEFGGPIGTPMDPDREPWEQRHLYGRRAGWYILDMKELTLVRRHWWWQ